MGRILRAPPNVASLPGTYTKTENVPQFLQAYWPVDQGRSLEDLYTDLAFIHRLALTWGATGVYPHLRIAASTPSDS